MPPMLRSFTSPQLHILLDGSIDPHQIVRSNSLNSLLRAKLAARHRRGRLQRRVTHLDLFNAFSVIRHLAVIACVSTALLFTTLRCGGIEHRDSRRGLVAEAFTESASMLETLHIDPSTGDVDAIGFLDAIDALTPALRDLGPLFFLASSQGYGNTAKLRNHAAGNCGDDPKGSCSLQGLVLTEIQNLPTFSGGLFPRRSLPEPRVGSEGPFTVLRWASFSLHFIEGILRRVASEEMRGSSMSECVSDAYEHILRPHHGPVLTSISKNVLRVVPVSRSIIAEKTGLTEGESVKVMVRWAESYARIRPAIERFYQQWPEHRP